MVGGVGGRRIERVGGRRGEICGRGYRRGKIYERGIYDRGHRRGDLREGDVRGRGVYGRCG